MSDEDAMDSDTKVVLISVGIFFGLFFVLIVACCCRDHWKEKRLQRCRARGAPYSNIELADRHAETGMGNGDAKAYIRMLDRDAKAYISALDRDAQAYGYMGQAGPLELGIHHPCPPPTWQPIREPPGVGLGLSCRLPEPLTTLRTPAIPKTQQPSPPLDLEANLGTDLEANPSFGRN